MILKLFKRKKYIPEDERLRQIIDILFPPTKTQCDSEGNKYHVDFSADANLDAALADLEEGHNDSTTHNTIRSISNRLVKIRQILDVYNEIDKDTKYYVVECEPQYINIENIQAGG